MPKEGGGETYRPWK